MQTKRIEKMLDENRTRMLRATLNKSWKQHPTKQQLYCHLPPIFEAIQIRRTRDVGLCLRSKHEIISNVLLWTPSHGRASVGRPARTYQQQLSADTGCCLEDLPGPMYDWDKWERERERERERESEKSFLAAWLDNDDDICTRCKRYFSRLFFVWALLLIVHSWNSSPLRSNTLRLQCTCTVQTNSGRPHGSPFVWAYQWPSTQPLSSPQLSHNDSLWA